MEKMNSNWYIKTHCNTFWQTNLGLHCTSNSVLLGVVNTLDSSRQLPDLCFLKKHIKSLNLEDKINQYVLLDKDYIAGFEFLDVLSKDTFEKSFVNLVHNKERYIILKQSDVITIQIRINAFPLLFTKDMLQEQLKNWGKIVNYTHLLDNRYDNTWKSNNISFGIELFEGICPVDLPCFVVLRGYSLMLLARGLPPVCHRCRARGHRAKDCPLNYCRDCKQFKEFVHDCRSLGTPGQSWLDRLKKQQMEVENRINVTCNNSDMEIEGNCGNKNEVVMSAASSVKDSTTSSVSLNSQETSEYDTFSDRDQSTQSKKKRNRKGKNKTTSSTREPMFGVSLEASVDELMYKTVCNSKSSSQNVNENLVKKSDSITNINCKFQDDADTAANTHVDIDNIIRKGSTLTQSNCFQEVSEIPNKNLVKKTVRRFHKPKGSFKRFDQIGNCFDSIESKIQGSDHFDQIQSIIEDTRLNNSHLEDINFLCDGLLYKYEHYFNSDTETSDDSSSNEE